MSKMNITSAQYKVDLDGITKVSIKLTMGKQILTVPINSANRHYQAIQEWVAEGNTIEEAD